MDLFNLHFCCFTVCSPDFFAVYNFAAAYTNVVVLSTGQSLQNSFACLVVVDCNSLGCFTFELAALAVLNNIFRCLSIATPAYVQCLLGTFLDNRFFHCLRFDCKCCFSSIFCKFTFTFDNYSCVTSILIILISYCVILTAYFLLSILYSNGRFQILSCVYIGCLGKFQFKFLCKCGVFTCNIYSSVCSFD